MNEHENSQASKFTCCLPLSTASQLYSFYAVKFHANGLIKFSYFLVIILVFLVTCQKKVNKQINKLGHCPGNEIKVLPELLWAVDYNHSSKEGSRFYSSDN